MQADRELEFTQVLAKTWAVFHIKASCQGPFVCELENTASFGLRILRIARGTRQWTAGELQKGKAIQVRMIRGVARWFPQLGRH